MQKYCGLITVGILLGGEAFAHHGFGSFDARAEIELTGTITGLDFVNPHSWLYFDVAADDGSVAAFRCELRPATALRRAGWTPGMFREGETITVLGSPDREDPGACYVSTLVFADGSRLDRYAQIGDEAPTAIVETAAGESSELPRLANGDPDISGDWAQEQPVMTDPRGLRGAFVPLSVARTVDVGSVPEGYRALRGYRNIVAPHQALIRMLRVLLRADSFGDPTAAVRLTDAGEELARSSYATRYSRCESPEIIRYWAFNEGLINRITQRDDEILLEYGHLGITRRIFMDLEGHPPGIEPSPAGHSIGTWRDDVLVIDTVSFTPGILWYPIGHGDQLHMVESFTFDPVTKGLTRDVVAEDPVNYEVPFEFSDVVYPSETPYVIDNCEEQPFAEGTN